ncbi:MAG: IS110 family transposase [Actinomycetota bacterium]|nr:IS110 family transposase [Actinomycetota bacterium]
MPDEITGGVDTHLDVHVAAALDHVGGLLGVESFPTDGPGYRRLVEWLQSFGTVVLVGVEGTGSYGAGLTRHLFDNGMSVVEVDIGPRDPPLRRAAVQGRPYQDRGDACLKRYAARKSSNT